MPVRTIYFDEAGYTGYNLLDPVQPIFAIASVDIDEQLASDILQNSFPKYQGDEFKFSNIWRSGNRAGLGRFCASLEQYADKAFCYAINKRFSVLTKAVDFLIEPYMTDSGYDFYGEGFAGSMPTISITACQNSSNRSFCPPCSHSILTSVGIRPRSAFQDCSIASI